MAAWTWNGVDVTWDAYTTSWESGGSVVTWGATPAEWGVEPTTWGAIFSGGSELMVEIHSGGVWVPATTEIHSGGVWVPATLEVFPLTGGGGSSTLSIQLPAHGHEATEIALVQTHVLDIEDAIQPHTAENIVLS